MKDKIPLSDLELNKKAKVIDIKCDEIEKRRYLDLGIVKDTILTPIFKSPFGNLITKSFNKNYIKKERLK